MARPVKEGLQYFPFDVDFFNDDKIQLLSAEYKSLGENLVIRLFCKIYGNGFFYKCSEDEIALLARSMADGTRPAEVKEIINASLHRNIFNKQLYDCFEILTSKGIQKRFIEATGRRKAVEIYGEFWLLDFKSLPANFTISPVDVNIYPNKCQHLPDNCIRQTAKSTQSKEKESKEKKIDNTIPPTPLKGGADETTSSPKPDFNTSLLLIFQEEFERSRGFPYPLTSFKGKEAKQINEAYQKYLQMKSAMGIVPSTEQALEEMRTFCRIAMQVNDKWIYDNMSPGVLDTKFTTIATMMKENRNGSYKRPNLTDDDIAQIAVLTGLK